MLVFISHSRENSAVALWLCDELRARGVRTWLDVRNVEPGSSWNEKVAEAVKQADAFVFVIGPPGPLDRWQRFEWEQVLELGYYLDSSKPLVPVLIGDAEMPGFLRVRQAIWVELDQLNLPDVAERVFTALRQGNTVDPEKYQRAREARDEALKQLDEYADILQAQERKRAQMRPLGE